jgi:nitroreductase
VDTYMAIVSKREIRNYEQQRPIPEAVVERILQAGRLAGSSQNSQPWRFFAITSRELLEQLAETVYVPGTLRGAALAVLIATPAGDRSSFDAGRAVQNMMLAAANDGVGSCPNGMPDPERAAALVGLGEGESARLILTFGYPARARDPESRSAEEWIARANRKPLDELVTRL